MLAITLMCGAAFGALVQKYLLEVPMSMKVTGTYGLELQWPNGTAITSYDWGDFMKGEQKYLDDGTLGMAYLANTGNADLWVYWDTSDPYVVGDGGAGYGGPWDLRIDSVNGTWLGHEYDYLWVYADSRQPVDITLVEVEANGGQAYTFDLQFFGLDYD